MQTYFLKKCIIYRYYRIICKPILSLYETAKPSSEAGDSIALFWLLVGLNSKRVALLVIQVTGIILIFTVLLWLIYSRNIGQTTLQMMLYTVNVFGY